MPRRKRTSVGKRQRVRYARRRIYDDEERRNPNDEAQEENPWTQGNYMELQDDDIENVYTQDVETDDPPDIDDDDQQDNPLFWRPGYWNRTESMDVEPHYLGLMDQECEFCGAMHFRKERRTQGHFTMCCHKGQLELPPLLEYPERLKDLMIGNDNMARHFRDYIRNYNSALAMASMGCQIDKLSGHGPYCFKIHGQVYHLTSALHPNKGDKPRYAQLYILDTEQAARQRSAILQNEETDPTLMLELSTLIAEINPYARAFKPMIEIEEQQLNQGIPNPPASMILQHDSRRDGRRYNMPTTSEIAVVFEDDDVAPPSNRDFRIYFRMENKTRPIGILNSNLDPMLYPLLFPLGEEGWTDTLKWNNERTRISQMQFYAYRIAIRDQFSSLHYSGKLFQQYLVDAYCKAEANRLNYIRTHQQELRCELYSGLVDYVANRAENEGLKAGKMLILPSSFNGSPRNMREAYMDAMRIVQKYVKPDLFITMTCNPNWREIQQNLYMHQTASDRPDLVARVFQLKKESLLNEIEKGCIFGKQKAAVHTIEFQKRGLPHAHILIILHAQEKPRCRLQIDKIVCAEIPDENVDADLRAKVLRHNIHNECRPESPCWDDIKKVCTKDFPKKFCDETLEDVEGYPLYKRRDTGRVERSPGRWTDNRYVVPYNAYLTKRYDCHINVEICSSVKAIKYLYKYIYKGHDCALVSVQPNQPDPNQPQQGQLNWDEIQKYLDARYVCAPEAAWRIFTFDLQRKSHAIVRLALHLENAQYTTFQNGQEVEAIENIKNTTLTAWFELNRQDEDAREFLYADICEQYTFTRAKKWRRRQRSDPKVISRLYFSSPAEGERHSLRLILLRKPGATSFEDLRTVDGIQYDTYMEAAYQLGLLQDDLWAEDIMAESALFQMPQQMRELFVHVCLNCHPRNVLQLFEDYSTEMCRDYLFNYSEVEARNLLLEDLEMFFIEHRKSLLLIGLPQPTACVPRRQNIPEEVLSQEDYNQRADQMAAILDQAQTNIYNDVLESATKNLGRKLFYLDGPGGSGKTYVYNTILKKLKGLGKKVLAVAFTGVAANLLEDGATSHNMFGIPIPISETSTSKIQPTSKEGRKLREVDLILWDEASMIPKLVLECADRCLKDVTNSRLPFGGKTVLLGGDFRQCLPVVTRGGRIATVNSCIKNSRSWRGFKSFQLNGNHRLQGDEHAHAQWLLQLGDGTLPRETGVPEGYVKIPKEMLTNNVIDELFPQVIQPEEAAKFADRAILCPLNEQCDRLNKLIIDRIQSDERTYLSVDNIDNDDPELFNMYPMEYINSINPSLMPPHKLNLKIGCIVMLLRNLSLRMGLCNGTRMIIRDMRDHILIAEVLTGFQKGKVVFIPRIQMTSNEQELPFKLRRKQFPIKLAFCMTISKSQGQTFQNIGVFLEDPVFAHGMLYVALSRSVSRRTTKIQVLDTPYQGRLVHGSEDVYVYNCVYPEIL